MLIWDEGKRVWCHTVSAVKFPGAFSDWSCVCLLWKLRDHENLAASPPPHVPVYYYYYYYYYYSSDTSTFLRNSAEKSSSLNMCFLSKLSEFPCETNQHQTSQSRKNPTNPCAPREFLKNVSACLIIIKSCYFNYSTSKPFATFVLYSVGSRRTTCAKGSSQINEVKNFQNG